MKSKEMSVRKIIKIFCTLGFSGNQLLYYVNKWNNRGFYDYGVTIDLGWFEPENLIGEYAVMYEYLTGKKVGNDGR
jgi:hypothetical protein